MLPRDARRSGFVAVILTAFLITELPAQDGNRVPPDPIPQIRDAPPLPIGTPSPDGTWLLLQERASLPPIQEVAAPMLRLAGLRIDPVTNGYASRYLTLTGYRLKRLEDGAEHVIDAPGGSLGIATWCGPPRRCGPRGRRIAVTDFPDAAGRPTVPRPVDPVVGVLRAAIPE